ncbi:MAG TPA: hypothetical protein VLF67_00610 [Candidatus Saccharimonas sp.]|nr:hypothetical protein [Candidatus Saccharimonas sp.]
MACNEDLVFGHHNDALLRRLHADLSPFDDSSATHLVAAMIWFDEQSNLRQPGDYVLITPSLIGWLLADAGPVNPEIIQAVKLEDEATLQRLTGLQPFEMKFEDNALVPDVIRGKTLLMRIMSRKEALRLSFIYTVRATGEFIYLPGFETQLMGVAPRTTQELS